MHIGTHIKQTTHLLKNALLFVFHRRLHLDPGRADDHVDLRHARPNHLP